LRLFLTSFFVLYGLLHCYILVKVRTGLALRPFAAAMLCCWMAFMVMGPVLVRMAERDGHHIAGQVLAYTAYTWMGLAFLFFLVSICFDLIRLLFYLTQIVTGLDLTRFVGAHGPLFFVSAGLALAVTVYGCYEAATIHIEKVAIASDKISANPGRLRIVQISDLHLGLTSGEGRLRGIIETIKQAEPDVLVATGDIVDVQAYHIDGLAVLFKEVKAPLGKFAVTGNHEFYAGIDGSIDFLEKAGFRVLRGEAVAPTTGLVVAGVDDYQVQIYEPERRSRWEAEVLQGVPPGVFRVLLKHRPIVSPEARNLFDVQLSGHTHKGQIFPFSVVTKFTYKTYAGLYELGGGSLLYVSRGTGTWGPPIRFLAPPEVTVFDVVHRMPGVRE
jgi:uncharacterized protein